MGKLSKLIGDDIKKLLDSPKSGKDISEKLLGKYPFASISVTGNPSSGYTINKIIVPKESRGDGIGTSIMNDILRAADENNATVSLTPSSDFGGSIPRLKKFYGNFGFIENKGKNKDFAISESMYRSPTKKTSRNILAGALPVGAIGAASMLSPDESYAQTVNKQALPRPDDVGSIKAPIHPRAAQMAGYFDKYNRAIEGTPLSLVLPEAPADWANKLAYDGKTRIKDRIIAALGML